MGSIEKKRASSNANSFTKELVSVPGPSHGPSLSPETVIIVCSFYESDGISHVIPGKKDFVSVKKEGKCECVQK